MLEAQEVLAALTVADWPHMSETHRRELHRRLHETAYPETHKHGVPLAALADFLGSG